MDLGSDQSNQESSAGLGWGVSLKIFGYIYCLVIIHEVVAIWLGVSIARSHRVICSVIVSNVVMIQLGEAFARSKIRKHRRIIELEEIK